MSEAGTSKQVESLHEQDELVRRRLQRTCSVTLPCLKFIDLDVPEDLREFNPRAEIDKRFQKAWVEQVQSHLLSCGVCNLLLLGPGGGTCGGPGNDFSCTRWRKFRKSTLFPLYAVL